MGIEAAQELLLIALYRKGREQCPLGAANWKCNPYRRLVPHSLKYVLTFLNILKSTMTTLDGRQYKKRFIRTKTMPVCGQGNVELSAQFC